MSAYVCDREHIAYLIDVGLRYLRYSQVHWDWVTWYHRSRRHELRCADGVEASRVGAMLWRENVTSVRARYPGESDASLPGPSDSAPFEYGEHMEWAGPLPMSLADILKAIHCYEYQSCEHRGWEASEAHAYCRALEAAYIRALTPGYELAAWGAPEACYPPREPAPMPAGLADTGD